MDVLFENFREDVIQRAYKIDACPIAIAKIEQAKTYAEITDTIKSRFFLLVEKEIIKPADFETYGAYLCANGIYLNQNVLNGYVFVTGGKKITARGKSIVVAIDKSEVDAYDNTFVIARNESTIKGYNNVKIRAKDFVGILAYDNVTVNACGNVSIAAKDNSVITAFGDVLIKKEKGVRIFVSDSVKVEEMNE